MSRNATIRGVLVLAGGLPFISWSLSWFGEGGPRLLAPWFELQCHGLLDRTVALAGRYFPVCSRCLGIYAGLLIAAVAARPVVSARARRAWLLAAAALMVLEVLVQDTTGHRPYHALRLLTGMLLAWPVALTLIAPATSPATSEIDR